VAAQKDEEVSLRPLDERGALGAVVLQLPEFRDAEAWDLSGAGDRVAAVLDDKSIRVVKLADQTTQELAIGHPCAAEDVAWDAAATSLIVTCRGSNLEHRLYRLHFDGRVRNLWTTSPSALERPSVSADGAWVVFGVWTYDPDFWLLSDF
jgi:hypothetical protein